MTKDHDLFILGVSASWCAHCCLAEPVLFSLKEMLTNSSVISIQSPVPIVRVDTASQTFFQNRIQDASQLPQIYGIKKGKFYKYLNVFDPMKILNFINKLNNPVIQLNTEQEVEDFLKVEGEGNFLRTVGFFFDDERDEDSPYVKYEEVAHDLINWHNLEMARVTDRELIKNLLNKKKYAKYHNSITLVKRNSAIRYLDLALPQDIYKWISK